MRQIHEIEIDPANSGRLLVQVNRGSQYTSSTGLNHRSGPRGATLRLVAVPSGEVTPLPVGLPDTPTIATSSSTQTSPASPRFTPPLCPMCSSTG